MTRSQDTRAPDPALAELVSRLPVAQQFDVVTYVLSTICVDDEPAWFALREGLEQSIRHRNRM